MSIWRNGASVVAAEESDPKVLENCTICSLGLTHMGVTSTNTQPDGSDFIALGFKIELHRLRKGARMNALKKIFIGTTRTFQYGFAPWIVSLLK